MIKHFFHFILTVLFLSSCHSSTVRNVPDTANDEQTRRTVSLFDTTSLQLKNTATFHSVEIKQMKFVPEEVIAHKGDTILWVNNDLVTHDITEEKNKEWTSSLLPVGKSWQMVATKSSAYYCSIHVMMKGTITME